MKGMDVYVGGRMLCLERGCMTTVYEGKGSY